MPTPTQQKSIISSGTRRFTVFVDDLPRLSLQAAIAVLAASWAALVFYDIILGDYDASPFDFDLLRALIPIAGLIPMFVRLLRPDDIADDKEAYDVYVRLTTITVVMVLITLLLRILPFSYTEESTPNSVWSFMVGRAASLVPMLTLPVIGELIVRLLRYRSKRSVPKLATFVAYAFVIVPVLAQLLPFTVRHIEDGGPSPSFIVAGFAALFALVLAGRARWIVNLRKRQKLAVLGLSLLGTIIAGFMFVLDGQTDYARALASTFPGLPAMSDAMGMALICLQTALFWHALIALPTAGVIDRRTTELTSLGIFSRLLTRSFDLQDLVDTSIGVACDVTGSRAAWIELDRSGTSELQLGATPRVAANEAIRLMSANMDDGTTIADAVRTQRSVVVIDRATPSLARAKAAKQREAVRRAGGKVARKDNEPRELCTVAAAPLTAGETTLGTLYVAKEAGQEFDRDDLTSLRTIADQVSLAMQHSKLIHISIERERIEQEMMIARDLQQRLLPRSLPASTWFDIHAESEPAHLVGGDYYDIVSFSDGTLGVVIADVAGKGASAALYMGMIKGVIQALAGSTATPRDLLAKINVALHGQIDQRWFATMTCAQILEEKRTLRIARAGHCPTLVVRGGVGAYHRSRGIGVAITRPLMFERHLELEDIHFSPDDYVVFLSDGLPESRSPEGEEFGYDRLLSVVTEATRCHPTPAELRNTIFNELSAFTRGEPPVDDSTIVLMRWKHGPEAAV